MTLLLDGRAPRVFATPPGADFAEALTKGLRARAGEDAPEAVARVELLLNTRRATTAVREAFEDAAPAVFLPKLLTLTSYGAGAANGPPAVDRLARQLRMTRYIEDVLAKNPTLGPVGAAGALADALGRLLDETQREDVALSALETAPLEDFAAHWNVTFRFLLAAIEDWSARLAASGEADPEAARAADVDALIEAWRAAPPAHPIIAAGSTGSVGTTARLLVAAAALPQGALVLPGFDFDMDAEAWRRVTPDHPQFGFARLLEKLDLTPADVRPWVERTETPRGRLLTQALRPAPVTHKWRAALPALAAEADDAAAGLTLIEAPSPRVEAQAIAVAMREALERVEGRIALVTPDRNLARRVTAALSRWGLRPDESGGRPLALTPPGVLASMAVDLLCRPFDQATFLACLKHPLCAAGDGRGAHLAATAALEAEGLRRRDVALRLTSIGAVENAIRDQEKLRFASPLAGSLAALRPWPPGRTPVRVLAAKHRAALDELAGEEIWLKRQGEALAALFDRLEAHGDRYGDAETRTYPELFAAALSGAEEVPEEAVEVDDRLKIWGTLEARSQSADVTILAGLNEGVWPAAPPIDPWLNRPMRAEIGLPAPERRTGLSAHDFLQAASSREAIFTRSSKAGGAPTTPSRWLSRLTTLLEGVDPSAVEAMRARGAVHLAHAAMLDEPPVRTPPATRPAPKPPAGARPRRLSVTEIETLIRDPYAIYAKRVLGLRPLDEIGQRPDARLRGAVLHEVVEGFVRETMTAAHLGPDAAEIFDRIAAERIAAAAPSPTLAAAWTARLRRVRDWFLEEERKRRVDAMPVAVEAKGGLTVTTSAGPFALTGRADRIDRRRDGMLEIYDYKAAKTPTAKQARRFAKQLPLLAAIGAAGGFENLPAAETAQLAYVSLSGSGDGGDLRAVDLEPDAAEGLAALISAYDEPSQPYLARAYAETTDHVGDYDHLARFGEWSDRRDEEDEP